MTSSPLRQNPVPPASCDAAYGAAVEPVAALAAQPGAWDALAARGAAGGHPFYARRPIEAHRVHGLAESGLAAVVVRRDGVPEALLPFVLRPDLTGLGGSVAQPFLSPFVTASAPLVADGTDFETRLDALVAGLAAASGSRAWRWPLLAVDGPTGAGLLAAMARAGWQVATVTAFARPVFDRRPGDADGLAGHPDRSRLKDLRRRRRRLGELGALSAESAAQGPALERIVEAFLALEAAGWKGKAGTALRCRPRTEAFARALFRPDEGPVAARGDVLSLDGRVIAASLALVAGGTATLLKTAYDETLRAHAPGLLLEEEIVRALHATAFAARLDSATQPGSVLEGLYPDRETVAEIVALPPGGSLISLERRVRLARFEHRARAEAKRLLGRR